MQVIGYSSAYRMVSDIRTKICILVVRNYAK